MISRMDHLQSLTISLGANVYASLTQLMEEWNQIMTSNKTQLAETSDAKTVQSWTSADKKRWWLERENLDLQIQRLLEKLEESIGVWKCLFLSSNDAVIPQSVSGSVKGWVVELTRSNKKGSKAMSLDRVEEVLEGLFSWLRLVLSEGALSDECDQITATNDLLTWTLLSLLKVQIPPDLILQQSIHLVRDVNSHRGSEPPPSQEHLKPSSQTDSSLEEITTRLAGLKVADLKSELKSFGLEVTGKKGELHDRLLSHLQSSHLPKDQPQIPLPTSDTGSGSHLVLLLDETFQSLPLECLPSLRSKSCSRVPSLVLLLQWLDRLPPDSSQIETKEPSKSTNKTRKTVCPSRQSEEKLPSQMVSLSNCWYSIDPEANLVNTRETIMSFMEAYISKWNWKGFSGQMPPDDIVR
jgi:hypothetical protein